MYEIATYAQTGSQKCPDLIIFKSLAYTIGFRYVKSNSTLLCLVHNNDQAGYINHQCKQAETLFSLIWPFLLIFSPFDLNWPHTDQPISLSLA